MCASVQSEEASKLNQRSQGGDKGISQPNHSRQKRKLEHPMPVIGRDKSSNAPHKGEQCGQSDQKLSAHSSSSQGNKQKPPKSYQRPPKSRKNRANNPQFQRSENNHKKSTSSNQSRQQNAPKKRKQTSNDNKNLKPSSHGKTLSHPQKVKQPTPQNSSSQPLSASSSHILSQPIEVIKRIQSAVDHIMNNGGPEQILNLPPLLEPEIGHDLIEELLVNLRGIQVDCTDEIGDSEFKSLPDWYTEFNSRFNDAKPGEEHFETNFALQYIVEYILKSGGPEKIETMPIHRDILGCEYVFELREIMKRAKIDGIFLDWDTLPAWYTYFLDKYGFPVPARKATSAYQNLVKHILSRGPDNIETMPWPGRKKGPLQRLQNSIRNQKAKYGKVNYLPCWYRHFIHDHQLPILYDVDPELFEPENLNKSNQDILRSNGVVITRKARTVQCAIDHILGNGGPDKIGVMPDLPKEACGSKLFLKLKHIHHINTLNTNSVRYPRWYLQFLQEYDFNSPAAQPDQLRESTKSSVDQCRFCRSGQRGFRSETDDLRKHRYSELWKYISDNGGHSNVRTMRIDHSLHNWDILVRLQISLFKSESSGRLPLYPEWYKKYISAYEPEVTLPHKKQAKELNKKAPPVKDEPVQMKPLMEYIFRNGGHANIKTMPFDQSVEGWTLLAVWQVQLKNVISRYVPDWYMKYLSEYEPDVSSADLKQLWCCCLSTQSDVNPSDCPSPSSEAFENSETG